MTHVVVDPVTRIEGHLRVEAEVDGGAVKDAWSSSTMFRGIELILKGRDPRDAWVFAQRICGVCTTVHAIASVRAVENAIGAKPPPNARLLRNLIMSAQMVQDHVVHFYHLHALDWVDIVSALSADPAKTSALAQSISDWPLSSTTYFAGVRDRMKVFVDRGQLGPFANAYWGHPAYKLPPEANLLALAHYLEALDFQREFIRLHAVLGGKNPHLQSFLVGGMATPIDPDKQASLNIGTMAQLKELIAKAHAFVERVYVPDVLAVASFYKEWASYGAGVGNYMVYGEYPEDDGPTPVLFLPSGIIWNKDLTKIDTLDPAKITEYVTHSWYEYGVGNDKGLHPSVGETNPKYTGPEPPYDRLHTDAKYSWLKSPRYDNHPMEVGPLARMLVAYGRGQPRVKALVGDVLTKLGGQFWGRLYYRVQQPYPLPDPNSGNPVIHSTFVAGSCISPLFNDQIEVRMLDTVENKAGAHQYIYNVQPKSRGEFGKGSPYLYHYTNEWTLAEWSVNYDTQSYHLYINGKEINGVALDKGATNFTRIELPKEFTSLSFGLYNYQAAGTGFVVWIDDIALAKERIGPLAPAGK